MLVVDDNVDGALMLARLLRGWGHQVAVAHDGDTAIELARDQPFDVVLLDIGLPGMDGYEVAQALRGQAGLDQTLLVALTGYGQDEDRRRSAEAGFDHHLVKPVDPRNSRTCSTAISRSSAKNPKSCSGRMRSRRRKRRYRQDRRLCRR